MIGEGTFGRVYRGRDRRLARPVAVKVIKPWWAEDPEWAESFEREARLLASISDPGIVQIFDVGPAPEGLYYVAELVDGESLASRLRGGRRGPGAGVRDRRAAVHARSRRRTRSTWSTATSSRPTSSSPGTAGSRSATSGSRGSPRGAPTVPVATIVGTPDTWRRSRRPAASPVPATDVYGVGVVLYEMLAGHTPFEGKSPVELALHHLHDPPPPLPASTPRALVRIVQRTLAKDPAERFRDGHELAATLARVQIPAHHDEALTASSPGRAAPVALLSRSAEPRVPAQARAATELMAPATVTVPRPGGDDDVPAETGSRIPPTRVGARRPPRRNFNPGERRQRNVLLALAVLIALGMAVIALELAPGHLSVPELQGMTRGRIIGTAHHDGFHAAFTGRYSNRPRSTAIGQNPAPGTRVGDGATVQVVLSRGPRPVTVPPLLGASASSAETTLNGLKAASGRDPGARPRRRHRDGHPPVPIRRCERGSWLDRLSVGGRGAAVASADQLLERWKRPLRAVPDPGQPLGDHLQHGLPGDVHVHLLLLGSERHGDQRRQRLDGRRVLSRPGKLRGPHLQVGARRLSDHGFARRRQRQLANPGRRLLLSRPHGAPQPRSGGT